MKQEYETIRIENKGDGLVLLMLFMGGCLRAAWVAGMRFERAGDSELEALSRAVLVAGIAFMTAAVFISAGEDHLMLGSWPAACHEPSGCCHSNNSERTAA